MDGRKTFTDDAVGMCMTLMPACLLHACLPFRILLVSLCHMCMLFSKVVTF